MPRGPGRCHSRAARPSACRASPTGCTRAGGLPAPARGSLRGITVSSSSRRWRWPCRRPRTSSAARSGCRSACIWWISVVMIRAPEPPSGWPSAIAPPRGLSRSAVGADVGQPGQGHRGEGLVDLVDADVVDGQAGPLPAPSASPGSGAVSMMTGSSPAITVVWMRTSGVSPSSRAFSLVVTSRAAAPSEIWLALPGADDAVLLERGLQRAELLQRAAGADALVGADHRAVRRASPARSPRRRRRRPAPWPPSRARRGRTRRAGCGRSPSARRSSRRRCPGSGTTPS